MKKSSAMKTLLPAAMLGSILLTGCARHYVVTLENGSQLSVMGKPKIEGGSYVFKDAMGQPVRIPKGSVREIAPKSMASSSQSSGFKDAPSK